MWFPSQSVPRWIIFAIDMSICVFSLVLAYAIRFDSTDFPIESELKLLAPAFPVFLLIRGLSFYLARTYRGIVRHTSSEDGVRIFVTVTLGSVAFVIASLIRYHFIDGHYFLPKSVIIVDYLATVFLLITFRFIVKLFYLETLGKKGKLSENVLIYGSGIAGLIAKRTIEQDTTIDYDLKGFVDDDEKKVGRRLEGVQIYSAGDLAELIDKKEINRVIIAIKDPNPANRSRVISICLEKGVEAYGVPSPELWMSGEFSTKKMRKVKIEDLLGRMPINLDKQHVSEFISGRTVLVTGGAGSIGSELVRQLTAFSPERIICLDQAESPLYELQGELLRQNVDVPLEYVIGDIRSEERLRKVFHTFKPAVVFHAAAYKHVPLMEDNPSEAILTNVAGTRILCDLAVEFGVKKFVMISTDKAVNPTNVMGASKRIAEIYAQGCNALSDTQFITTRFGNVLGSNGSVIPLFRKQIERGGPVTVTDPRVTRYFMTIKEACQLVLNAGALGEGGEIFVFDMGESVRIMDLAENMIRLSGFEPGRDIEIKVVGLRPGEKLYEELLADEENTLPTPHEKILRAKVRELDPAGSKAAIEELVELFKTQDNKRIVTKMKELVPEFRSENSIFVELD